MNDMLNLKSDRIFPQATGFLRRPSNNRISGRHAALRGFRQCSHMLENAALAESPYVRADNPILAFQQSVRSCRGFTLLEIMMAVAIMAIVLVSVYKLHAQTISMNGSTRFYTTAPLLAQRTLAEIQAFPDRRGIVSDGDFGDDFSGYRRQVSIEDVDAEIFGTAAKDFKKIEVTISFNQNEFVYTLRTYAILQEP